MTNISKLTLIRFLELVLVFALVILDWNSFEHGGSYMHTMLVVGTFVGYLIILVGLFASGLMETPVNRRVNLFFSAVGTVLFLIAGGMIIHFFQGKTFGDKGVGTTKGVLALVEGVLMLIDAVLTFRGDN